MAQSSLAGVPDDLYRGGRAATGSNQFVAVLTLLAILLALAGCAEASGPAFRPAGYGSGAPQLLVRLDRGGWPGQPGQHVTDYLTDGTVIWVHDGVLESNRLTEAGLATVVTTLTSAESLLSTPLRIEPRMTILPMNSTRNMPEGIIEPVNTFVLERPDGSRYAVTAPSRPRVVGDPSPDPTVEGLTALGSALADPAKLVGSGGLAGSWETYQPAKMAIFLTLETIHDPGVLTDTVIPRINPTDWPFKGTPGSFGTVFTGPGTHVTRRCALLPTAEASTAVTSLSKIGGRSAAGQAARRIATGSTWSSDVLLWIDGSQATMVHAQAVALMPEDGAVSCIDALSY